MMTKSVDISEIINNQLNISEYSSGDEVEDGLRQEMENELQRKMKHPERMHKELWFNEPGEVIHCHAGYLFKGKTWTNI